MAAQSSGRERREQVHFSDSDDDIWLKKRESIVEGRAASPRAGGAKAPAPAVSRLNGRAAPPRASRAKASAPFAGRATMSSVPSARFSQIERVANRITGDDSDD